MLAIDTDANALVDLRVVAMRPSLEAIGRFDPVRARQRFLKTFDPQRTWKIEQNGELIGFFVLIEKTDHFYLDHLYLVANAQGQGIGRQVLDHIKGLAIAQNKSIHLCALIDSEANRFYQQNDFQETHRQDFDVHYEYRANTEPQARPRPTG